jgi:lipopolysaccharide/colanic/teichoic acid biosynthesis glycosyltransferase
MTAVTLPVGSSRRRELVKRTFDVLIAASTLIVLSPALATIALAIVLDSRGPVFYARERPGRDLKPFRMLKFRSMTVGADALKPEEFKALGYGPQAKAKADPRITRVGRVLRKLSLDELPQLINVLRGEMSIVGPRPLLGWEMDQDDLQARSSVLPGITGLWQVSGRSNLSFGEMLELDLRYVERHSFWMDLGIMLRTLPAMVGRKGAY